jgi:hypothetical protein
LTAPIKLFWQAKVFTPPRPSTFVAPYGRESLKNLQFSSTCASNSLQQRCRFSFEPSKF